jgi:nicotinamidase-related amidase
LPAERLFLHPRSGAFYKTALEEHLREIQCENLLITGIALDYGLSSTAREALNLRIHPILVRGACYAYDILDSPVGAVTKEELERAHLAALYRMGGGIMSVNEVIAALVEENAKES